MKNKKAISVISYLTILGWIVAFILYNKGSKSKLAKYHLEQAFGIAVISLGVNFAMMIMILFLPLVESCLMIINLVLFTLCLGGIINALYGVKLPLPLIGNFFKDKFSFI